ncbi:hypothetical protein ACFX13_018776 [Malus domestica]
MCEVSNGMSVPICTLESPRNHTPLYRIRHVSSHHHVSQRENKASGNADDSQTNLRAVKDLCSARVHITKKNLNLYV